MNKIYYIKQLDTGEKKVYVVIHEYTEELNNLYSYELGFYDGKINDNKLTVTDRLNEEELPEFVLGVGKMLFEAFATGFTIAKETGNINKLEIN